MTTSRHESIKDAHARVTVSSGAVSIRGERSDATLEVRNGPAASGDPQVIIRSSPDGDVDFEIVATISQQDADSIAWDLAKGGDRP